jgi:site-specific recombinase XerD
MSNTNKAKDKYPKQISIDLGYDNGRRIRQVSTANNADEEKKIREDLSTDEAKNKLLQAKLKKGPIEDQVNEVLLRDFLIKTVNCRYDRKLIMGNVRQATKDTYISEIAFITGYFAENIPIATITKDMIQEYLDVFSKTHSDRSIAGAVRLLGWAFEKAYNDGIIKKNIMLRRGWEDDIIIPKGITKKAKKAINNGLNPDEIDYENEDIVEIFTQEEEDALINACKKNIFLYAVLHTFFNTGVRVSELLALKLNDIAQDNKGEYTLTIRRALNREVNYVDGGRRQIKYVVGKTKSGKSRSIALPHSVIKVINDYVTESNNNDVIREARDKSGFIFLTEKGIRQTPAGLRSRFSNMIKREKLDYIAFNFHKCRHTFASKMIEHGAEANYLKAVLGHTDVSVTYKYYVGLTERMKQVGRRIIDNMCNESNDYDTTGSDSVH